MSIKYITPEQRNMPRENHAPLSTIELCGCGDAMDAQEAAARFVEQGLKNQCPVWTATVAMNALALLQDTVTAASLHEGNSEQEAEKEAELFVAGIITMSKLCNNVSTVQNLNKAFAKTLVTEIADGQS